MTQTDDQTRFGFIALIGAPNAGKSTLLNTFVGEKVSIVTPKVQTTRTRVLGITIEDKSQMVFIDTPGIFAPKRRLDRAMVNAAWDGAKDADYALFMVDVSRRNILSEVEETAENIRASKIPFMLVLNKIDQLPKAELLPLAEKINEMADFRETFMISAKTGEGVAQLREYLANLVPEGPWMYEEDQISTMPMRLIAAEITREKLFMALQQELPYHSTVETEDWEQFDNGSVKISQVIFVTRDGHKGIILGKGGQQIKAIGEKSRKELEKMLETRVHLSLFVKVRKNWMDDPDRYTEWDLNFEK